MLMLTSSDLERAAQRMITKYGPLAPIRAEHHAMGLISRGELRAGRIWLDITSAISAVMGDPECLQDQ